MIKQSLLELKRIRVACPGCGDKKDNLKCEKCQMKLYDMNFFYKKLLNEFSKVSRVNLRFFPNLYPFADSLMKSFVNTGKFREIGRKNVKVESAELIEVTLGKV